MSNTPTDPFVGQQLANFRIEKVIKRGGMAQVYYGWDVMLRRPVAIKIIDDRYGRNPNYAERFLREARAVATWRHENITQVHYADKQDDRYYFVMEYVDGEDLKEMMRRHQQQGRLLPHDEVLRLATALTSALDYAHSRGVIHRDVKPSNVLVSKDERVLLTDFGLAMTVGEGSLGEIFGTPHYIAPEQALNSADAMAQSDLYSLTVILYEMLTGALPFDDPSAVTLAVKHVNEEPPLPRRINPDLSESLESFLISGLQKAPQDRYQSGAELLAALQQGIEQSAQVSSQAPLLPPIPAAAQATISDTESLSRLSVAGRMALELGLSPEEMASAGSKTAVSRPRSWLGRLLPIVAAMSVLFLLITFIPRFVGGDDDGTGVVGVVTAEPTTLIVAESRPTETAVPPSTMTPTAVVPTATAAPANPTATTAPPTATTVPASATIIAVPATVVATTTVTATERAVGVTETPTGQPIRFIFDDNSFYVLNPGGPRIAVEALSFEALDSEDQAIGTSFRGREWSRFYRWLERNSCVGIEPADADRILRPAQCLNYNATVNPSLSDANIFWTGDSRIVAFRVYWLADEIGRCPVVVGVCDLRLPDEL